ncbi:MAG: septum formation initiator family protein [Candidatus Pacebacteria bacterium]|nr:septum formation initiator family protein [Candidatus Paceibacterota bacterium]
MLTKKKKKIKKEREFKVKKFFFILIISSLFVFFTYSCINMFIKLIGLNQELKALESEQESLLKQRESLKFSLGESYSESYLEKVAREDLNLKREGETIYIIKKEGEEDEEYEEIKEDQTFVQKIQSFLKSFNK